MKLTITYMLISFIFTVLTFVTTKESDSCYHCAVEYSFNFWSIPLAILAIIFLALSFRRLFISTLCNQVNEYGARDLTDNNGGLGD